MIGFVAGHLTQPFPAATPNSSGSTSSRNAAKHGVASELLLMMGAWFADQGAVKVMCRRGTGELQPREISTFGPGRKSSAALAGMA